ncbi:MAG: TolC family protein [Bacteroidia bacterium]
MRYFRSISRFVINLLITFLPVFSTAQMATLPDFLDQAKMNNPQLKDFVNQQEIAGYENAKIHATYRQPSVDIRSQWMQGPIIKGVGYDEAITNGALYSAIAGVSYPLFTRSFLETEQKQQTLLQEKAKWLYEASWRQLQMAVSDQYITCFFDQMYIQNAIELRETLAAQLKMAETLARSGIMKASDVQLLKIETGNQKLILADLNAQLLRDLRDLYSLCGITDTARVSLSEPQIRLSEKPGEASRFEEQFYIDSLLAQNQLDRFNLKYKPQVSAFADAGLNAVTLQYPQKNLGVSFGINFSLNIFDGHQKQLTRAQTHLEQQTTAGYQLYFNQQKLQLLDKYIGQIEWVDNKISIIQQEVVDYNNLLELYKKELQRGDLSVNDYLVTFRNYVQFNQQLIEQQKQKYLSINAYNYWNW